MAGSTASDKTREHENAGTPSPETQFAPEPSPVTGYAPAPALTPPVAAPPVAARPLTVGRADDAEEVAADRVAERVVAALEGAEPVGPDEHGSDRDGHVHRRGGGAPGAIGAAGGELGDEDSALIAARQGGGSPLAPDVRDQLGGAMGADLSGVRLHTGPEARGLNQRMSSVAFTAGSDVFFRDGAPDLSSKSGRHLIAHELAHVVQQGKGADGVQRLFGWGEDDKDTKKAEAAPAEEEPSFFDRVKDFFGFGDKKPDAKEQGAGKDDPDAKAKADQKAKEDADAKAKAEADKKAKDEADAKAKEDADKKAKEEADARAKEEADKKAKEEADARAKAEADAKAKEEADKKAKDEADAKAKAEAEKKAKEEADAKAKAEEERKKEAARKAQEDIDRRTKDYGGITALRLPALQKYVTQTPDWDKNSTLSELQRTCLSLLVGFAQTPASGACPFTMAELLATGSSTAALTTALATLTTYGKAVQNDPFPIGRAATVAQALKVGADLTKLLSGFPRWVLATAMKEKLFTELCDEGLLDDLIDYYKSGGSMRPVFQAETGRDFDSYLSMRLDDNVDPRTFQNSELKGYIRNFHRFEGRLLDRLILNMKNTERKKPLTLILHSNLDHNGAFHRDKELFRVVDSSFSNTIMIEGGETLADYKSQITPMAQKYGMNNKIDQVMFAGHGNAQLVELAGSVVQGLNGKLTQDREDVDVTEGSAGKADTDALFDEVLKNMDQLSDLQDKKQPNRRILFNACLTNSNVVGVALTGDEQAARDAINDWIQKNMSLATYLNDRAKKSGVDTKALGANASINVVKLMDAKGGLDMVTAADPKVTASKLEYAQEGKEPTGVMRAALEAYGKDGDATRTAMEARCNATSTSSSFDDLIIWSVFNDLLNNHDATESYYLENLRLYAELAEDFSHLKDAQHASLANLRPWLKARWGKGILDTLIAHAPEAQLGEQGLMLRIARLAISPTDATCKQAVMDWINHPSWTVKVAAVDTSVGRYLDFQLLESVGVLPALLAGPPTHPKLLVALAGLLESSPPAACVSYLRGIRKPAAALVAGLPAVPAVPEVLEQPAPRGLVPEVPAVPGRPKVVGIPGQRTEVPEVPDLPKLDALPAVELPVPQVKKDGDTKDPAKLAEAKPADTKPLDAKPLDAKPADTKPLDAKPADAKPADAKPADAKPADAKPADTKPVDAKPADAKAKPADAKAVDTKPVDTKAADTKPVDTKPVDTKPVDKVEPTPADAAKKEELAKDTKDSAKNPKDPTTATKAAEPEKPAVVVAPGRKGRPERKVVDPVPKVDPYFDDALNIEDILDGATTLLEIMKKL